MTFGLILIGVYTAAAGAGLACSAQWPFCDGGLFPKTLPSFIEWFHRLVAMITGFFILGTAAVAWRRHGDRPRVKWAATVAAALLIPQVLLGALTVRMYTPPVQVAHHGVAMALFAALLATTLWAYEAAKGDAVSVADTMSPDDPRPTTDG